MRDAAHPDRRAILGMAAAGLALGLPGAKALAAPPPRLMFEIWRNGRKIGSHAVSIVGGSGSQTVTITAELLVKLGPIPLFRYRHDAKEVWRDGHFMELTTLTVSNGRRQSVTARREGESIAIAMGAGAAITAPGDAHPLTHWNPAVLNGPLFNPQDGTLMHESVARAPDQTVRLADGRTVSATRYALTGKAEITDWYDLQQSWTALRGRVSDGSYVDYRRIA